MIKHDRPKLIQWLLPIIIVCAWFAATGIGGPYFGKISQFSENDLSTFLPSSSDAAKANKELGKFRDSNDIPAIVIFESDTALDSKQTAKIQQAAKELSNLESIGSVSPAIQSEDKNAAIVVVPIKQGSELKDEFAKIRESLGKSDVDMIYKIGGPAAFSQDIQKAFSGIDFKLLVVTLVAVFIILLLVYRSPFLPFIVLFTSMAALSVAVLVVSLLAQNDIVNINGQVQGILFILVIGATTDYSLLYLARLREEFFQHDSRFKATLVALKGSFESILAAGGTVIVGLMCLLLSDLESNKSLGPVGGIGIALAIFAALTLLPSLLLLGGRAMFWPKKPHYDPRHAASYESHHPLWAKVAKIVVKHPRRIWLGTLCLLVLASFGFTQLKADGVPQSQFVLGKSEAREAQDLLDKHFPGGSGAPAYVIVDASQKDEVIKALDADEGVASLSAQADNSPSGTIPVGKSEDQLRQKVPVFAYPFRNSSIKTRDDKIVIEATLRDPVDSDAAFSTLQRLRDKASSHDSNAIVGGTTAVQYDTKQASNRDKTIIIPVVLLAITIILGILLRSLVAPFVLLATTVISFTATLGVSALLFNNILGFPGADPSVVLFGFVFLVALGIDYNIFLMTRAREETLKHGVRKGTLKALVVTGGVITSAGVVLAATFASLSVIPILFLVQLAFIVAFGVLLDTIIVRALLVPALTLEIGKYMWWPTKIDK